MGHVIAVAMNKGGVGKTVTAVSLAAVAARSGWRTLLVDADHQGNAYLSFGGNVDTLELTLADVLFRGAAPAQACVPLADGLGVLPAHDDLALVDFEVLTHRDRYPAPFRLLREALAAFPPYDLVFIDTPPSLGLMTGNALAAADAVLVPVQAEHFALECAGPRKPAPDPLRHPGDDVRRPHDAGHRGSPGDPALLCPPRRLGVRDRDPAHYPVCRGPDLSPAAGGLDRPPQSDGPRVCAAL